MMQTAYADVAARHGFIPANHQCAQFEQVEARKLFDEDGRELPGWLRIHNVTRGKDLHVASDQYRVITNEEAFTGFEDAIRQSGLRTGDMVVGTDYSHDGARIFRQYLFPDHMVQVKPGVDVALRIIMFNSYDGTMAFRGTAGAFNFVCANTSIVGHEVAGFKMKHNGKADAAAGIRSLVSSAAAFAAEADEWKRWPSIRVEDAQAVGLFKAAPGASEAVAEHLALRWLEARDSGGLQSGPNLWALYNVLTAWATHTEGKGENKAASRYTREGVVQKAMGTVEWKALMAG